MRGTHAHLLPSEPSAGRGWEQVSRPASALRVRSTVRLRPGQAEPVGGAGCVWAGSRPSLGTVHGLCCRQPARRSFRQSAVCWLEILSSLHGVGCPWPPGPSSGGRAGVVPVLTFWTSTRLQALPPANKRRHLLLGEIDGQPWAAEQKQFSQARDWLAP